MLLSAALLFAMDDSAVPLSRHPAARKLRRRNSFSSPVAVPSKLSLLSPATSKHLNGIQSSSFSVANGGTPPHLDLELLSLKSSESYTSLKDLLPAATAAVNSPTAASAANSGYEISIRNRLVKQAAWAYLQPMSSSSGPSGPNFFRRLCLKLNPCISFFTHRLLPLLRRTLRCIGLTTDQ